MAERKSYTKTEGRRWHPDYQPPMESERSRGRVLNYCDLSEEENCKFRAEIENANGELNIVVHPGSIAPNHKDNLTRRKYLLGITELLTSPDEAPSLVMVPDAYYVMQVQKLLEFNLRHNIYCVRTFNEDPVIVDYVSNGARREKNPFVKNIILAQSTRKLSESLLESGVNKIRLSGSNLLLLPLPSQHIQDYLDLLDRIEQMGEGGKLVSGAEKHFLEVTGQMENPRFCLEACVGHIATHLMPWFDVEISDQCYPHNGRIFREVLAGADVPPINLGEFVDTSHLKGKLGE